MNEKYQIIYTDTYCKIDLLTVDLLACLGKPSLASCFNSKNNKKTRKYLVNTLSLTSYNKNHSKTVAQTSQIIEKEHRTTISLLTNRSHITYTYYLYFY